MNRLSIEREDAVAVVRFVNPPHGYMDSRTVEELGPATEALANDDAVRAIVFTGAHPGVFVRHYDVSELNALAKAQRSKGRTYSADRLVPERRLDRILERLETMPKPAIAAINGTAMGGGFEFCLACDLRYAERGPFALGQPEANIGILAGAGGTQRLAKLIGEARALEMNLLGRTVAPDEAAAIGMVHAAVDRPVMAHAMRTARRLAAQSPRALAHIKRLIRGAADRPLHEGLALERTLFMDLLVSDEAEPLLEGFVAGTRSITD
jgi:enoyl-CoA hydratase